jgi:hypothetical protein
MKFTLLLALVACSREVQQAAALDVNQHRDIELHGVTDSAKQTNVDEVFKKSITGVDEDVTVKLDVDPVPATATTPAVPGRHLTVAKSKHGGAVTEEKNTKTDKSATKTADVTGSEDEGLDMRAWSAKKTETELGGFKLYIAGILALIVLLAAGYFYLKMVKKVSWL